MSNFKKKKKKKKKNKQTIRFMLMQLCNRLIFVVFKHVLKHVNLYSEPRSFKKPVSF